MNSLLLPDIKHLSLLAVGNAQHNGDWNYGPINSPYTRIYYVYEGCAKLEIKGQIHQLTPGHLYIIPPFVTHIDRSEGAFCHFYAHFIDHKQKILHLYNAYDFPIEINASSLDRKIHERLCELCADMSLSDSRPVAYDNESNIRTATKRYEALPEGVKIEIYALLIVFLARFMEHARMKLFVNDERISRALKNIDKNIHRPLTIRQLAHDATLSKDHFIRQFRQLVGETPGQYIMKKRVQQAQILLSSTDMRIKEVASALGFDSESYFDRVFLRYVHLTPMAFRRQNHSAIII